METAGWLVEFESFANSKRYKTPGCLQSSSAGLRALLIQKDTKRTVGWSATASGLRALLIQKDTKLSCSYGT